MELYDKLNRLEEKLDSVVAEITEARNAKEHMEKAYEELLGKVSALETELEQARQDKEAIRQKIETLINKLG